MAKARKKEKIGSREELVLALRSGAVLEHMLLCEYLYCGFSIRRSLADFPPGGHEAVQRATLDRVRPWLAQIYRVARQEMDHLGIVCNLLAAVGEEPYFERPDFPQPARRSLLDVPFCLDRFSTAAVQRFVWYERPEYLTPGFPAVCCGMEDWKPQAVSPLHVESQLGITSLGELYTEIADAFERLPARELFTGAPDRQLGDVFSFKVKLRTVTNREEARQAIHAILVEGEGIGLNPLSSTCHFQVFTDILTGLEEALASDSGFDPALPVVTNPLVMPHDEAFPASVVRRPDTVAVMRFFNDCYHTMLDLLKTFFALYTASSSPEPRRQAALFYAAFFPMMTMALRPLGEMLARMPAGDEFPGRNAGASFEIDAPVEVRPDLEWHRDHLSGLAGRARDLCDVVPDYLRTAMRSIAEGLTGTALHLEHIWREGR